MLTIVGGNPHTMLEYDFQASVGYWVYRTKQALERALGEELAPLGITTRQWQVLACLAAAGGKLSPSDLAERMGLELPTLLGILDRMERDRWIVREACASDRRKKWVRAARRAIAAWPRIVACALEVRARATRGMGATRLHALRAALDAIQRNLELPEQS